MSKLAILLLLAGCGLPPAKPMPQFGPSTVVPVRVESGFWGASICSGIAIHPNWALTAAHCVDDSMWVDGLKVELPLIPNQEWDMAMLQVPGLPGPDVVWADHKPQIGEYSTLIGWGCSKLHDTMEVKFGRVESIDDRDITYDASVCGGDSGGPVLDSQGRLIGLISRMVEHNHHAVVQYLAE